MREKESLPRKAAFWALQLLDYDRFLFSKNRQKQYILTYHGVSTGSKGQFNNRHLPAKSFEEHLKYIQSNFHVLPLSEVAKFNKGQKSGKPSVAITFDDGFENNYSVAAPLLKSYSIPATFFVSAICIEDSDYILWSEVIEIVLSQIDLQSVTFGGIAFQRKSNSWLNHERQDIYSFIKELPPDLRDNMLEQLKKDYAFDKLVKNINSEYFRLMNKKQVEELSRDKLFEIGSHGYLHYNLPTLSPERCETELAKSKMILEEIAGKPIKNFAFPDSDYNADVKRISTKTGYEKMFTENYLLHEDYNDAHIFNRFSISNNISTPSNFVRMAMRAKEFGF